MKTYDILLNPKAEIELNDLPDHISEKFKISLRELSKNPKRFRSGADIKKLTGTSDPALYRLRIGKHRAIYWVDEERREVLIEKIAPRKKAYKGLDDMGTEPYPLRIPTNLLKLAEARSAEEHIDKSTAMRQLMYKGAEDYIVELISRGRLSVSRGAELLDTSVHEIYRLAKKKGVEIGATIDQYEKGEKTAEEVIQ